MNPFEYPDQVFDLGEFLELNQIHTEILFKEFFYNQLNQEFNDGAQNKVIKNYLINRYTKNNNIEIIQAYNNSQAAYLYLIYEAKYANHFPFTERLRHCSDLGDLTPYDIYSLTIHNIFDKDLCFNDYVAEIEKIIILHP